MDAPELVPGMVASPQAPTPNPRKRAYVQFGPPPAVSETLDEPRASASGSEPLPDGRGALPEMAPRPRREKRKADSRLIAAARELRDRWLEKLDENPSLILPQGKYDVARELPEANDRRFAEPRLIASEVKALPEAA